MKKSRTDYEKQKWTGGNTTELYLYPEDGDYESRDFIFRISVAQVEEKDSKFTILAGIDRKFMLLDGELALSENGRTYQELDKFVEHDFYGEWETRSFGKCTCINLMLQGAVGSMHVVYGNQLDGNGMMEEPFWEQSDYVCVYQYKGRSRLQHVTGEGKIEDYSLEPEESCLMKGGDHLTEYQFLELSDDAICIVCSIEFMEAQH